MALTSEQPAAGVTPPPYPADTRAKGWRFELDHERIRQSDTWALAPAELRPWLLMLWMVAWEQTPCGSMPVDDHLICARVGMQPKAFTKAKAVLMRGWDQASDGRLYHPVIAERVLEMLESRRKAKDRQDAHRGRTRDTGVSHSDVTRDSTVTNGTGTSTGTCTSKKDSSAAAAKSRRARLPDNFAPNEAGVQAANAAGLNLAKELQVFRDWHQAQGSLMADWQAAWRTWVGKAVEFGRGGKAIPLAQADWATAAGFDSVYEAENAGCRQHNAHLYREGKRIKEVA